MMVLMMMMMTTNLSREMIFLNAWIYFDRCCECVFAQEFQLFQFGWSQQKCRLFFIPKKMKLNQQIIGNWIIVSYKLYCIKTCSSACIISCSEKRIVYLIIYSSWEIFLSICVHVKKNILTHTHTHFSLSNRCEKVNQHQQKPATITISRHTKQTNKWNRIKNLNICCFDVNWTNNSPMALVVADVCHYIMHCVCVCVWLWMWVCLVAFVFLPAKDQHSIQYSMPIAQGR